jgi:hypothetical protein
MGRPSSGEPAGGHGSLVGVPSTSLHKGQGMLGKPNYSMQNQWAPESLAKDVIDRVDKRLGRITVRKKVN